MDHLNHKQREINPEERTNFLTNLFFVYTRKIFIKGFKTDLVENDIYEVVPSYRSKKLGKKLEKIWEKLKSKKKFSMPRFLWKSFGMQYLPFVAAIIIHIGATLLRPKLIKKFVGHFSKNHTVANSD
ncbi:hypothetical protein MTP99_003009 [Tenebrio molitor]|nr:hypothetical protein MTP99_003009 [Tenebrio molitor]